MPPARSALPSSLAGMAANTFSSAAEQHSDDGKLTGVTPVHQMGNQRISLALDLFLARCMKVELKQLVVARSDLDIAACAQVKLDRMSVIESDGREVALFGPLDVNGRTCLPRAWRLFPQLFARRRSSLSSRRTELGTLGSATNAVMPDLRFVIPDLRLVIPAPDQSLPRARSGVRGFNIRDPVPHHHWIAAQGRNDKSGPQ